MGDQYRAGLSRIRQSPIVVFCFRYRAALGTLVFAVATGILVMHHEPWRDEAQAWLIARDTPNILALLRMGGYEGTPLLWHLLLMPFAKLGLPFSSAQLLNVSIVTGAAYVFLKKAPFSFFNRLLFVFGYFMVYEYGAIARSYGFFVLLIFVCALCYGKRFRRPILYACSVAFLAQTTLFGTITAFVLACSYTIEGICSTGYTGLRKYFMYGFGIAFSGVLLAVAQLLPPLDLNGNVQQWHIDFFRVGIVVGALFEAFMPIPIQGIHFWNSNAMLLPDIHPIAPSHGLPYLQYFLSEGIRSVFLVIGIALYPFSLFVMRRIARVPLIIYGLTSFLVLAVFFFKYFEGARHSGIIFILFMFFAWISAYYSRGFDTTIHMGNRPIRVSVILTFFLLPQIIATPIAYAYEMIFPFSSSGYVRHALVGRGFMGGSTFVATYPATYATPILLDAPVGRVRFFSLEDNEERSFMLWNRTDAISSSNRDLSAQEVVNRFERGFYTGHYIRGILILRDTRDRDVSAELSHLFRPLGCMGQSTTISDEMYCIYEYIPSSNRRRSILYD
ncbi:hypothetical protein HY732_00905 [Candidatus Uhrbacteria bacterium]|nr:hypothetical protein [Candidatus Uhrbacteria bacterium]